MTTTVELTVKLTVHVGAWMSDFDVDHPGQVKADAEEAIARAVAEELAAFGDRGRLVDNVRIEVAR